MGRTLTHVLGVVVLNHYVLLILSRHDSNVTIIQITCRWGMGLGFMIVRMICT